jgi:N-methylhydantoinase A/oxoprolinase/acetone carboxylase beta subunit
LVKGGVWMVEGGHEYDGRAFMPLDEQAVRRAAREIKAKRLAAVAISGIFSPLDPSHERQAAAIVAQENPGVAITCSADLGRIGLLERENAGLLNAALCELAHDTVAAFETAIRASAIDAPLFITQNDGTIADAAQASRLPVYSFASGATNSMRGGAYLCGVDEAMVVDVGGTTTDVGQLKNGFPREANSVVRVAGVRTLFRMPDLVSIGLGGGSHVSLEPLTIGPLSVGYRLLRDGIAFGGSRLTASDIAIAAGWIGIGDRTRVAHLDAATIGRVLDEAKRMIEESVDRMKTQSGDIQLIAVGGGAFLVPDRLAGVSRVIRVPHADCANAVGAAIAQVSGEVDRVFRDLSRGEALARAAALAADRAIAAGAERSTLKTVESEDIPIAYLPGNCLRVRVRVVGDVAPLPPDAGQAADLGGKTGG